MRLRSSEAEFIDSPETQKGRDFENDVKKLLQEEGFIVLHNYQLPDLLAIDKHGSAIFIECKAKDSMKDRTTGYDLSQERGADEQDRMGGHLSGRAGSQGRQRTVRS